MRHTPKATSRTSLRTLLVVVPILALAVPILATRCEQPTRQVTQGDSINAQTDKPKHTKIVRTHGAQSGVVKCEALDNDGHIWFSIAGEGAYRFDGESFTHFTTDDGLCSDDVNAIIQDRTGSILLATNKGICRYDGHTFSEYLPLDRLSITCLFEDTSGAIWFGTIESGIYRYDGETLSNYLNDSAHGYNLGSRNQLITSIIQDNTGSLWFSSWNGGGVWMYDGTSFKNFIPSRDYYESNQDQRRAPRVSAEPSLDNVYPQTQEHIPDDMIFSMTQDSSGNIWFATRDHGVCRYDGRSFTNIRSKEGFPSRGAYRILEDRKGDLWFTTEKDGIWRYDGRSFKNFTEEDGLVNNAVLSILEDKDGNLWFGTKWFGLSRYDGNSFTTFSRYQE